MNNDWILKACDIFTKLVLKAATVQAAEGHTTKWLSYTLLYKMASKDSSAIKLLVFSTLEFL